MANHSSATVRRETPHSNRTTRTNTIINALKQRALSVLNDKSIDAQTRAILRHALETNDPWLAEMVRRAEAGETIVDTTDSPQTLERDEAEPSREKIEALAEIICGASNDSAAACLSSWERFRTPTIPQYWRIRRSTLLSLAAVS